MTPLPNGDDVSRLLSQGQISPKNVISKGSGGYCDVLLGEKGLPKHASWHEKEEDDAGTNESVEDCDR